MQRAIAINYPLLTTTMTLLDPTLVRLLRATCLLYEALTADSQRIHFIHQPKTQTKRLEQILARFAVWVDKARVPR